MRTLVGGETKSHCTETTGDECNPDTNHTMDWDGGNGELVESSQISIDE